MVPNIIWLQSDNNEMISNLIYVVLRAIEIFGISTSPSMFNGAPCASFSMAEMNG